MRCFALELDIRHSQQIHFRGNHNFCDFFYSLSPIVADTSLSNFSYLLSSSLFISSPSIFFHFFLFFFFIFLVGVDHPPTSDFTLGEKAFAEQPFCINEMFAFPFCTLAITFKKNIYRSLFNSNTHVFHFPVFRCLHMVLIVIINDGKCFVS